MNNLVELKKDELTDLNGGFILVSEWGMQSAVDFYQGIRDGINAAWGGLLDRVK